MAAQVRWRYVGPDGARSEHFSRMLRHAPSSVLAEDRSSTVGGAAEVVREAVYLSVPFEDRGTMTAQLVREGIAVLVEGPITSDPSVANAIRDLSILSAVPVAATTSFSGRRQHDVMRDLVRDGAIGRLRQVNVQVSSPLLACDEDEFEPGWHDAWTAGAVAIDAMRSLAGSDPVSAVGWIEEDEDGSEHSFSGVFRFVDDLTASVAWSVRAGYGAGYTLVGDSGTIEAPSALLPASPRFGTHRMAVITDADGRRVSHALPSQGDDVALLSDFADLLIRPSGHLGGLDDFVGTCAAMDLMRSAARRPMPRRKGRQWNLSRSA